MLVPVLEQQLQRQVHPLLQQIHRFRAEQLNNGLQLADAIMAVSISAAEAASLAQTALL